MNAQEARREAVKSLAARLRSWNVPDPFKHAEDYVADMGLAGWIWMPPSNRPVGPRPGECCLTCGRSMHLPDRICDEPTRRPVATSTDANAAGVARLRAQINRLSKED